MTPHEKVATYIPFVGFLAEALGNNYEIVLHDLTQGADTILAIHNSHVSGRDAALPLNAQHPYLLEYFRQNRHRDYIANYSGKTSKGKTLRSSTLFIKDGEELIGFICINCDITSYCEAREALDAIISRPSETILFRRDREDDVDDMRSIVEDIIAQTISGLDVQAMSAEEKRHIVELLNERGVFLLKGTPADVAKRLDISMQTLYRYLKNSGA